jgi:hypothetical protein
MPLAVDDAGRVGEGGTWLLRDGVHLYVLILILDKKSVHYCVRLEVRTAPVEWLREFRFPQF